MEWHSRIYIVMICQQCSIERLQLALTAAEALACIQQHISRMHCAPNNCKRLRSMVLISHNCSTHNIRRLQLACDPPTPPPNLMLLAALVLAACRTPASCAAWARALTRRGWRTTTWRTGTRASSSCWRHHAAAAWPGSGASNDDVNCAAYILHSCDRYQLHVRSAKAVVRTSYLCTTL